MNRFYILLLLFFLSVSIANALLVEQSHVSKGTNGTINIVSDVSSDNNNEITLSKFPKTSQIITQNDSIPPISWVIGLGLCLIFFGYKMKNKAH